MRLFYSSFSIKLEGYTDACWMTSTSNNKSMFGWVFILKGGAVSWALEKQTCNSHSIMKPKFIALAASGKQAEQLRNLHREKKQNS